MTPTGQRYHLNSIEQLSNFNSEIKQRLDQGKRTTVQFLDNSRSNDQNAMLWAIIREIVAADRGDTEEDIHRYIKLHFCIPILRSAHDDFRGRYDRLIKDNFDYSEKLEMMDFIPASSLLSIAQFTQVIDQVIQHYMEQGYTINDPHDDL